jgi:hypothetical protein
MVKYIALMAVALLAGCATPTEHGNWAMVDGSKSDGVVTLGIDVPPKMGVRETMIQWDVAQADGEADRRCKSWGYAGADMYRNGQLPVTEVCQAQGISPCWSKKYRVKYQCVDSK